MYYQHSELDPFSDWESDSELEGYVESKSGNPLNITPGDELISQEITIKHIPDDRRQIKYVVLLRNVLTGGMPYRASVIFNIDEFTTPRLTFVPEDVIPGKCLRIDLGVEHKLFQSYGKTAYITDALRLLLLAKVMMPFIDAYVSLLIERREASIPVQFSGGVRYKYYSGVEHQILPDIENVDKSVMIAVHADDDNVFLAVYFIELKKADIYDSFLSAADSVSTKRTEIVKKFIRGLDGDREWEIARPIAYSHPPAIRHGLQIIRFARCVLLGEKVASFGDFEEMEVFARDLAFDVLAMNAEGRKILRFLYETNN